MPVRQTRAADAAVENQRNMVLPQQVLQPFHFVFLVLRIVFRYIIHSFTPHNNDKFCFKLFLLLKCSENEKHAFAIATEIFVIISNNGCENCSNKNILQYFLLLVNNYLFYRNMRFYFLIYRNRNS